MKVNNLAKSIIVQEYETQFKEEFNKFLNYFSYSNVIAFGRKRRKISFSEMVNLNKDLKLIDIVFNHYLEEKIYDKSFILKTYRDYFIFFGIFDLKINEDESDQYFLFYQDYDKKFMFLNNDEARDLFGRKIFINEKY